jgi:hypothetical protein
MVEWLDQWSRECGKTVEVPTSAAVDGPFSLPFASVQPGTLPSASFLVAKIPLKYTKNGLLIKHSIWGRFTHEIERRSDRGTIRKSSAKAILQAAELIEQVSNQRRNRETVICAEFMCNGRLVN